MKNSQKTILLVGGGTGGSVTPLLTIANFLKTKQDYRFLFVGTKIGIEKRLVEERGLEFRSIFSGKFRRYFSLKNVLDIFLIFLGILESLLIIIKERPSLMIAAGSFVSVPVALVCGFYRIPILIIQLDVRPGLANKLIAPIAKNVLVVFKKSLRDYGKKAIWIGMPFDNINSLKEDEVKGAGIAINNGSLPLVLVMGGGTGSDKINKIIKNNIDKLSKICFVVHLTGIDKDIELKHSSYLSFDFLKHREVLSIMQKSDLVVSRAGLGTIMELAYFKKPAIVIPIAHTHQEDNAQILADRKAALVLPEDAIMGNDFIISIAKLIDDKNLRDELSQNIESVIKIDDGSKLALAIRNIIK